MKASAAAMFLCAGTLAPTAGVHAGEADLAAALRQQIVPCWTMLPGMAGPEHSVTLIIKLKLDGSLDGKPETAGNNGSPGFAGSARRAVLKCQPYHLPTDKYDLWKEIKITFRPGR
jgi:hypothetical protein